MARDCIESRPAAVAASKRRSQITGSSGASASRRFDGFTLVELLVVVSIIALLVALLLPVLERARDAGRDIKCASNMRQVYLLSTAFESDYAAIMPNQYFPRYPRGFDMSDPPDDRGTSCFYGHMLINMGYAVESERLPRPTTYTALKKNANTGNRLFACPSMWMEHRGGYYDTRITASPSVRITDDIERRSAAFWYDVGYRLEGNTAIEYHMFNGYYVNNLAGSWIYYHLSGTNPPNSGVYPRRSWKSAPSKVAYLMEDYMWTSGGYSQYADSITKYNYAWGGYEPPIRHNSYHSTNMIFADGHRWSFPTPTYMYISNIPFKFE